MHTAARLLAPLLLTLGLLGVAPSAHAEDEAPAITVGETLNTSAPSSAHRGPRKGVLEAGWVRAACSANAHGVRCAIRVPQGARVLTLDHRIGGRELGVESTYMDREEYRDTAAPQRHAAGTLAGVRLSCDNVGQRVECVIDYPARTTDLVVNQYVRGWDYGGIRAKGLILARIAQERRA